MINNDKILTKENISKPFFIVELIRSGELVTFYNYIFIENKNFFIGIEYEFCRKYSTNKSKLISMNWIKKQDFLIKKRRFNQFFNNVKRKKCIGSSFLYYDFYVTKFTPDSIESYLMQCGDDYTCIDEFYKIIEER